MLVFIDAETQSVRNLKKISGPSYALDCRLLCVTWAVENEPVQLWEVHKGEPPYELCDLLYSPETRYVAHNAMFDRHVLAHTMGTLLSPESWHCTMAMAHYLGLPGGLDKLCPLLGLDTSETKADGKEGIKLFSGPKPWMPWEKPDEWERFMEYAVLDTVAMRALYKRFRRIMPKTSLAYWDEVEESRYWDDQRINDRGLGIDLDVARVASSLSGANRFEYDLQITELTKGRIRKAGSPKLLPYLDERYELKLDNLRRETIEETLAAGTAPSEALELLRLRRDATYNSLAKFQVMLDIAEHDPEQRARGCYLYHGAHTGRLAGRAMQPQNLARPVKGLDPVEVAEELRAHGHEVFTRFASYRSNDVLASCIRSAIVPRPRNTFYVVDYSNIEARLTALFADSAARLDLFRKHDDWVRRGEPGEKVLDLYEHTAIDVLGENDRQAGKMMELGLGFGMGHLKFGGINGLPVEKAQAWVDAWRARNPEIPELWKAIETICAWPDDTEGALLALEGLPEIVADMPAEMFADELGLDDIDGVETRAKVVEAVERRQRACNRLFPHLRRLGVRFRAYGSVARTNRAYLGKLGALTLPSGKPIHYLDPARPLDEKRVRRWNFGATNRFGVWEHLHGGLLTENAIQGTARELMVHHIAELHSEGAEVVGSSHDEVIVEVPCGDAERLRQRYDRIVETPPKWLDTLPLRAESYLSPRYTKH